MPKVPKIQYLHKSLGDEVDFLPGDKHKGFLQDDRTSLGNDSITLPKVPKMTIYNIYEMSQGKHEG